jgi:DNA processing protein
MTRQGGLLTEYPTRTTIEKGNFVQRNRIVAGLADATVVVESAERGGSLITANLASSYGREVFAFPGRISDEYSKGCNRIIYNNLARSIRSAQDLFEQMGWQPASTASRPVQQELFVSLTSEEQKTLDSLTGSDEGKTTSEIVAEAGISFSAVSIALFELESKGLVDFIGGGRYRRIVR